VLPSLSALQSASGPQNIAFAGVISLLFLCQRANAYRDRVSGLRIEVKGIVGKWLSLNIFRGVILSGAAFQGEGRISHAHASDCGRSLTRLNCAGFRMTPLKKADKFKLSHYQKGTINSKPTPHP